MPTGQALVEGCHGAAHGAHIEADLIVAGWYRQHAAPQGLVDLAVTDHQADLAGGRVERALEVQLRTGLQQHFVLVDQVGTQGGLGAFGEGEVVGAGESGAVPQLIEAHPHRRRRAVGPGFRPWAALKYRLTLAGPPAAGRAGWAASLLQAPSSSRARAASSGVAFILVLMTYRVLPVVTQERCKRLL